MKKYYSRLIEKEIDRKLKSSGAVVIVGPKFCGKTTTAMLFQKSMIRLNTKQIIQIVSMNPAPYLEGDKPRLIDEWQTVPDIWNSIKNNLDLDYEFGKFILTGSSTPADKEDIYHSGAGRITPIKMKTMSLFESNESKGLVSLSKLFEESKINIFDLNNDFTLEEAAYLICRGGWPISLQDDKELGLEIMYNYYNSLFIFEYSDNEKFRDLKPETLKTILASYARNISTEASISSMLRDLEIRDNFKIDRDTLEKYIEALNDLYIIEDVNAWNPNIRSKTSIRTTPTRHFVDTSIACRALNISPNDLVNDLNTMGLFFEDLAVRDLKIYANTFGGEVRHYRDNAGLECDAIIHLPNGKWGAIEIKLGGEKAIDDAAKSLKLLKNKIINKSNEQEPSFMMILTAVGSLYQRDDGIIVVPINCLKH
jgi:predicted AAA+ superfamily ATPase